VGPCRRSIPKILVSKEMPLRGIFFFNVRSTLDSLSSLDQFHYPLATKSSWLPILVPLPPPAFDVHHQGHHPSPVDLIPPLLPPLQCPQPFTKLNAYANGGLHPITHNHPCLHTWQSCTFLVRCSTDRWRRP
jgi:hypothetical protein